MRNVDWARKLTSRKFWAAVASFVAMLIVAMGGSENVAMQITSLIMAGATVIAYILGEGMADAASVEQGTDVENLIEILAENAAVDEEETDD